MSYTKVERTWERKPKPYYRNVGISVENNSRLNNFMKKTTCTSSLVINLALSKFFEDIENCKFGFSGLFSEHTSSEDKDITETQPPLNLEAA